MPTATRVDRPRRLSLLILPIAIALSGSASADAASTDIAQSVLRSQARLTEGLIRSLAQQHPGNNIVVSPASLAGMLTAADFGAGPTAHEAIRRTLQIALGAPGTPEMEALSAATIHIAGDPDLTLATRLMFDRSEPPTAEGRKRLDQAGVETAVEDLHGPAALADIDAWAARATAGKITHVLDRVDPLDQMIALNALLFKAPWSIDFRQSETRPADFHLVSGQRIRAPFMHMHEPGRLPVREDDRFIGVEMPFADGRYAMVVVTTKDSPTPITDFRDHLTWLSGEEFQQRDMVFVDMPPFHVQSRANLMNPLKALGFDPNDPFSAFTEDNLFLSDVTQIIDINVDEAGAEVAAVTSGGFEAQGGFRFSNVTDVVVDKPFAYALRDTGTGLIIVAGFMASIDGQVLSADASSASAGSPVVATPAEIEANAMRQTKARAAMEVAKHPPDEPNTSGRLRLERDF